MDRVRCLASHVDVEEKVVLEGVGERIAVPVGIARSCSGREGGHVRRHWRVLHRMRVEGVWVDCE